MQELEVIYMGRRLGKKGECKAFIMPELYKLTKDNYGSLLHLLTEEIEVKASYFLSKKERLHTIGGIYRMQCRVDDDGRIIAVVLTTARYVRLFEDESMIAAWTAMDNDAIEERRILSLEKRAIQDTQLMLAIRQLRLMYQFIPPTHKRSFQVWLLRELEKK